MDSARYKLRVNVGGLDFNAQKCVYVYNKYSFKKMKRKVEDKLMITEKKKQLILTIRWNTGIMERRLSILGNTFI